MKRIKRITALLVAVLMCLSLCGCQALEDMRAAHAFWQEDGSILWNGSVYRLLKDVHEDLYPIYGNQMVYVTKSDVPVLLSEAMGEPFDVNAEGTLLYSGDWENGRKIYCRIDLYDEIQDYLTESFAVENYFYNYYYYDSHDEETKMDVYYLTDKQKEIVDRVIATANPIKLDDDFYVDLDVDEYIVTLNGCDKQHLFSRECLLEIAVKEERYYLIMKEQVYAVSPEHNAVFADIVDIYYKNEVLPYC